MEPCPQNAVNFLRHSPTGGAFLTMSSVMWFTFEASSGIIMFGFTSVLNSEMSLGTTLPFSTATVNFTAPISTISSLVFISPVVSRSNATNFGGNVITTVTPFLFLFLLRKNT